MGAGRPSAWSQVVVEDDTILVPKAAAAKTLGANASWLSSLNVSPVRGRLYDLRVLARAFVAYREGIVKRRTEKAKLESDELVAAKVQKTQLEAERLELQNRERRGELVDIEHLAPVITRALAAFTRRLTNIPRKLAAEYGIEPETEAALKVFIDDALGELADLDYGPGAASGGGVVGPDPGHQAAAEPVADGMGEHVSDPQL